MIISFSEENDENDEAKANALSFTWTYIIRVTPAAYLAKACGREEFDCVVLEVTSRGLGVGRSLTADDLDDPNFSAAFLGWDDIKEVHVY